MSSKISAKLRRQLVEADDHCCAYCQTSAANTGQPVTVDHVLPASQGGETEFENLCLACRQCNEFKGANTFGVDPLTGEQTSLFHPRRDKWLEHFLWDGSGSRLIGVTDVGRATIVMLNMNNEVIVRSRLRWVSVGWHPPQL